MSVVCTACHRNHSIRRTQIQCKSANTGKVIYLQANLRLPLIHAVVNSYLRALALVFHDFHLPKKSFFTHSKLKVKKALYSIWKNMLSSEKLESPDFFPVAFEPRSRPNKSLLPRHPPQDTPQNNFLK